MTTTGLRVYVGEPLIEESLRQFIHINNPDILGYYEHRKQVFVDLCNQAIGEEAIGEDGAMFFYQRIIHEYNLLIDIYKKDCVLASNCCSDWIAWRERNPIDESHDDWFFRHEMRDDDSINTQPDYSLDPM